MTPRFDRTLHLAARAAPLRGLEPGLSATVLPVAVTLGTAGESTETDLRDRRLDAPSVEAGTTVTGVGRNGRANDHRNRTVP